MSDELVVGATTHVIAARNLNAEDIARRLEQVPEHAAVKCYEVIVHLLSSRVPVIAPSAFFLR